MGRRIKWFNGVQRPSGTLRARPTSKAGHTRESGGMDAHLAAVEMLLSEDRG